MWWLSRLPFLLAPSPPLLARSSRTFRPPLYRRSSVVGWRPLPALLSRRSVGWPPPLHFPSLPPCPFPSRPPQPPRLQRMAWTCSAGCHADLTAALVSAGLLRTPALVAAFGAVDRGAFVPPRAAAVSYADAPQGIGWGATISAPHMHAMCLELLGDVLGFRGGEAGGGQGGAGGGGGGGGGDNGGDGGGAPSTPPRVLDVLDVGVGSGYLAAVLAVALGPRGHVVGVDHVAELVSAAADSLGRVGVPVALAGTAPATAAAAAAAVVAKAGGGGVAGAEDGGGGGGNGGGSAAADGGDGGGPASRRATPPGTVELHVADGRVGLPGRTWDAIHVGAAADGGVPPPALVAALKVGGRMVVPVSGRRGSSDFGGGQVLVTVDRVAPGEGGLVVNEVCGVRYVPLCEEGEQRAGR
ncbi:hypothetical protein I4F81_007488 [Pyropia yezoensis]|uniref:Uncharacterized protein n=1 Tax=Pyropia yezoensis TaxID=2788 RepID=A0ACC3C482_PYRYE|nr:hypothetical protein I4F81_007488 [Neopyropia yezoensis]